MNDYITISRVDTPQGQMLVCALFPPGFRREGVGIANEQIIGVLKDTELDSEGRPKLTPDNFARHAIFVEFMHKIIEFYGKDYPGFKDYIKNDKPIYVIDNRCPEDVMPEQEDIIGQFNVVNSKIVSYSPNSEHRIFSEKGFTQVPPPFDAALFQELAKVVDKTFKQNNA